MTWKQIKKLALSGRALWTYASLVLAGAGGIYAHLNDWGFQFPALVLKHELPTHLTPLLQREMPVYLDAFGKQRIDPIGTDVKRALEAMAGLKVDLVAANGREAAMAAHIGHLIQKSDRLERLLDRVYGRASRPADVPVSVTPEAEAAVRAQ